MENIFHRISVRRFEDRPVEREKTKAILRAAMQAPSAANQQPCLCCDGQEEDCSAVRD